MIPRDFCYWLRGFMELNEVGPGHLFSVDQCEMIKDHLDKVFTQENHIYINPYNPTSWLCGMGTPGVSC